jgi:hypothetical protein
MGLQAQAKTQKVVIGKKHSSLTTDAKFDGTTVGGKIQAPLEALSVVENEKDIDDLIGVRKDFRDRSDKAKGLR